MSNRIFQLFYVQYAGFIVKFHKFKIIFKFISKTHPAAPISQPLHRRCSHCAVLRYVPSPRREKFPSWPPKLRNLRFVFPRNNPLACQHTARVKMRRRRRKSSATISKTDLPGKNLKNFSQFSQFRRKSSGHFRFFAA